MLPAIWTSPRLSQPAGKTLRVPWSALERRFLAPRRAESKEGLSRWAPVDFRDAYRCRANVRACYACVLDLDDGSPLELVLSTFEGVYAIVHSTFSATSAAPRWRVIVPLDEHVGADAYERVWRWLASALEGEGAVPDYAARDAPHAWAVPAVPPHGYYEARVIEGAMACAADGLMAIPAPEAPAAPVRSARDESYEHRVERARRYLATMPGAISGSGGHAATWKATIALARGFALEPEDVLMLLVQDFNPRCAPAWALCDLKHKVRQAMQRARQPFGYLAERGRT